MLIGLLTAVFLSLLLLSLWYNHQRRQALLATVEVVTIPDFPSLHLGNKRPIYIYLPPHYRETTTAYKLLYLHDGQDREALQLHETLAKLTAQHKIQPLVVVAVPTTDDRLHEYGTAVCPNARGLGSKAGLYTEFLLQELMPRIRQEFRVLAGAENTALMGISLGGLSAFDIAWNHRKVFGTVGVFSGSFWWRSAPDESRFQPDTFIMHAQVRGGSYHPGFHAWLQAATQDETGDRDGDGVIDAIQDTRDLIGELQKLGYTAQNEVAYLEVAGGRHEYGTWAKVLPHFLTWAFPAS